MATLLGTPVQSDAIQYNSSAIVWILPFYEVYNVQFLLSLCKLRLWGWGHSWRCCCPGLHYTERCFSFLVLPVSKHDGSEYLWDISEYNVVQYNSTTNSDLSAKTYHWIYTKITKTEHYKLRTSIIYSRAVVYCVICVCVYVCVCIYIYSV